MITEQFKQWLKKNSITEVECLVPDLGGIARGKILPTNKFIKGLNEDSHRLPQSIFIQTISGGYATEDDDGLPPEVYNPTDILPFVVTTLAECIVVPLTSAITVPLTFTLIFEYLGFENPELSCALNDISQAEAAAERSTIIDALATCVVFAYT